MSYSPPSTPAETNNFVRMCWVVPPHAADYTRPIIPTLLPDTSASARPGARRCTPGSAVRIYNEAAGQMRLPTYDVLN